MARSAVKPDTRKHIPCASRGVIHIRTAGAGRRTLCGYVGPSNDLKRKVSPNLLGAGCRRCAGLYLIYAEEKGSA